MGKVFTLLIVFCFLLAACMTMLKPISATSTENTWVTRASMPQALAGCKAAVFDGKIFVMGGLANYMYDPTTDIWTAKTTMPTPRMYFAIAVFQNEIYVIGGRNSNSAYSLNEVYYPSNDSWETKTSMPIAASDIDANTIGEKIFVIWGSENLVYNVLNDSWNNGTVMPHPVSAYAATVFNDRIYFFGGSSERTVYCNYTQIYNPNTDSWASGVTILTNGPENVAMSAVATSGALSLRRIYVLGGWSADDVLSGSNRNRLYDPKNDSWTFGEQMPTGRVGVALAVVDDTIYAIGGSPIYISFTSVNEQYYPFGYGTPDLTTTPSPLASPFSTPAVPEYPSLIILTLLITITVPALLVYFKKHKHIKML